MNPPNKKNEKSSFLIRFECRQRFPITNLRVKFKFKQDINFVIEIEQQITIKENTVH